jgi:hypothetical protein
MHWANEISSCSVASSISSGGRLSWKWLDWASVVLSRQEGRMSLTIDERAPTFRLT